MKTKIFFSTTDDYFVGACKSVQEKITEIENNQGKIISVQFIPEIDFFLTDHDHAITTMSWVIVAKVR